MKKFIFLVVFITLFSVQTFAQDVDTLETLRTRIESAAGDSDRLIAIESSNAFDPVTPNRTDAMNGCI